MNTLASRMQALLLSISFIAAMGAYAYGADQKPKTDATKISNALTAALGHGLPVEVPCNSFRRQSHAIGSRLIRPRTAATCLRFLSTGLRAIHARLMSMWFSPLVSSEATDRFLLTRDYGLLGFITCTGRPYHSGRCCGAAPCSRALAMRRLTRSSRMLE